MKRIIIFATIISCVFVLSCKSTQKENNKHEESQKIAIEDETKTEKNDLEEFNNEYTRSTLNVDVSIDDFNEDKKRILQIINELNVIMGEMNYNKWETYVDSESLIYWSKKANLQKAASRLPIKGIKLNSLRDYFIHVFLPSRKGHEVTEIRYETRTLIKAVQVTKENDVVYYTFRKINNDWKLYLPKID